MPWWAWILIGIVIFDTMIALWMLCKGSSLRTDIEDEYEAQSEYMKQWYAKKNAKAARKAERRTK